MDPSFTQLLAFSAIFVPRSGTSVQYLYRQLTIERVKFKTLVLIGFLYSTCVQYKLKCISRMNSVGGDGKTEECITPCLQYKISFDPQPVLRNRLL